MSRVEERLGEMEVTLPIAMYQKFGFVEYGRLPEGVLHNHTYVDTVYMYRKMR